MLQGELAQLDVVRLRTGGVLQRTPEAIRRMDPNLDTQSTDDLDAGLGIPLPQDAFDLVEGDEGLQDLARFPCRDQQVQIADGFLPAADAPPRPGGGAPPHPPP